MIVLWQEMTLDRKGQSVVWVSVVALGGNHGRNGREATGAYLNTHLVGSQYYSQDGWVVRTYNHSLCLTTMRTARGVAAPWHWAGLDWFGLAAATLFVRNPLRPRAASTTWYSVGTYLLGRL